MSTDKDQQESKKDKNFKKILHKSLIAGFSGSMAMTISVFTLMWLRTIMNYQYRYGGTFTQTVQYLYKQGGLRRFYQGISLALIQGPISRFGDTFANSLIINSSDQYESTKNLSLAVKSSGGSILAALFRICLTPIDTLKTTIQVEGKQGVKQLVQKTQKYGPRILYHGALASAFTTFIGHYPWFLIQIFINRFIVYNILNQKLQKYNHNEFKMIMKEALVGFIAAGVVSDSIVNSIRVLKTTKQTSQNEITYYQIVCQVVEKEGVKGFLGRGLRVRIFTNGIQSLFFVFIWKSLEVYFTKQKQSKN